MIIKIVKLIAFDLSSQPNLQQSFRQTWFIIPVSTTGNIRFNLLDSLLISIRFVFVFIRLLFVLATGMTMKNIWRNSSVQWSKYNWIKMGEDYKKRNTKQSHRRNVCANSPITRIFFISFHTFAWFFGIPTSHHSRLVVTNFFSFLFGSSIPQTHDGRGPIRWSMNSIFSGSLNSWAFQHSFICDTHYFVLGWLQL